MVVVKRGLCIDIQLFICLTRLCCGFPNLFWKPTPMHAPVVAGAVKEGCNQRSLPQQCRDKGWSVTISTPRAGMGRWCGKSYTATCSSFLFPLPSLVCITNHPGIMQVSNQSSQRCAHTNPVEHGHHCVPLRVGAREWVTTKGLFNPSCADQYTAVQAGRIKPVAEQTAALQLHWSKIQICPEYFIRTGYQEWISPILSGTS